MMNFKFLKTLSALAFALALGTMDSAAQFYNGHQMNFGQNRVQYTEFHWLYYRYPKFDTYYYQEGKDLAQYTSDRALEIIPEMERYFGKSLQRRIIFIVFNRIEEFRQSNIGLVTDDVQTNLGGVTKIVGNKVFLYFDGDHNRYDQQIREAVAGVLLNVSINGTGIRNRVTTSASTQLPEWFVSGMPYYAAHQWTSVEEDIIRDGFESGRFRKIQFLTDDDAKYAGYSMWYYINRTYGRDAIPSILYLTAINKNPNVAINQVLNLKFKQLNKDWRAFYNQKFGIEGKQKFVLQDSDSSIIDKYRRNTLYYRPLMSPTGQYTLYATNKMGKYRIFLIDNDSNTQDVLLRGGHKLNQIQEYNYPVAAWHPTGRVVSYVVEEEGYPFLYQYNVETAELRKKMLPKFDKVFSMNYSDDGLNMVMSVQFKGTVDIVVFNIGSGSFEQITNDLADDINPRFIDKSTKIVFASNRIGDTLAVEKGDKRVLQGKSYDIFVYDYKKKDPVLRRITDTKYENETLPYELSKNSYTYLSDRNGVVNRYASVYDSTIIAIDTIVHYSYSNSYKPVSNLDHSIVDMSVNKQRKNVILDMRSRGRYIMRHEPLDAPRTNIPDVLEPTYFRTVNDRRQAKSDSIDLVKLRKAQEERRKTDSIVANPPKNLQHPDSMKYDITNYYFEEEKSLAHQLIFYQEDIKERHRRQKEARPHQKGYYTNFYTDYLVSQVDFSSLSQSYQPFTGGPYYFDPGASAFFKVGCKDLFEDLRLSAAFRMGGSFDSYEYYFSFEDLRKRFDKQYVFHRNTYIDDKDDYTAWKVATNEAMVVGSYPFNQVSSVRGTLGLRYDKAECLILDNQHLDVDPQYQAFAKAKLEYCYDNSRMLFTNIYNGTRFKAWTELYQQVEGNYDIISSWGFDFRHYQKLHRCLIFASRVAGATSFGSGKILYYLGGVDNWTTFSSDISKRFDQSVRIDQQENYIYQAVGTNMRGFIQNCRNGNTFCAVNTELRFPVFRYLANRPLSSKMINDFQIVGFFDAGSAWTGFKPNADNAYNKYELNDGPINMVIDVTRPTVVAGYGWGFRTSILGYFARFDWAWGIEGHQILPRVFYFSLGMDF